MHNSFDSPYPPNTTWFGGTAIAIAYTSDINAVKPSDMTVISVNYTSPWKRLTEYQIPAGLPACPDDGCLCTWNWIHRGGNGEGYPWEMVSGEILSQYYCAVRLEEKDRSNIDMGWRKQF